MSRGNVKGSDKALVAETKGVDDIRHGEAADPDMFVTISSDQPFVVLGDDERCHYRDMACRVSAVNASVNSPVNKSASGFRDGSAVSSPIVGRGFASAEFSAGGSRG